MVQAWLKTTEEGKKYRSVHLLTQGTTIRILSGLYSIGDIVDGVIAVAPWVEAYSLLKYYGVAGLSLGIFSNSERIAL